MSAERKLSGHQAYPDESTPITKPHKVPKRGHQLTALLMKQIKLQMRHRCTVIFQILIPLIMVVGLGALNLAFVEIVVPVFSNEITIPASESTSLFAFPYSGDFWAVVQNDSKAWGYMQERNGTTAEGILSYYQQYARVKTSGPSFGGPCILGPGNHRIPFHTPLFNYTCGVDPVYPSVTRSFPTKKKAFDEIKEQKQAFYNAIAQGKDKDRVEIPSLFYRFLDLHMDSAKNTLYAGVEVAAETQMSFPNQDYDFYVTSGLVNILKAFYRSHTDVPIEWSYLQAPFEMQFHIALDSVLAALFYPLLLSFIMPAFVYNIIYEKANKTREMMKMMGLKMHTYWIVTIAYNWALYLMLVFVTIVLGIAFKFDVVIGGHLNFIPNLFTLFLWGNMMIGQAMFIAGLFSSPLVGLLVSYLLVFFSIVISFILNITVFAAHGPPLWWYFIYPPFTFYRIVTLQGLMCLVNGCFAIEQYDIDNPVVELWFYMIFFIFFLYLGAFYLDEVGPRTYGVRKPWYFPIRTVFRFTIRPLYRLAKKLYLRRVRSGYTSIQEGLPTSVQASLAASMPLSRHASSEEMIDFELSAPGGEPLDVVQERQLVDEGRFPEDSALVVKNLRKTFYRGKKVAVKDLSFHIPNGQCFGFLGANGAGKTTTISILTGLFSPTSGGALVGGYDLSEDLGLIQKIIGICPQFDILWADLTCSETIHFYGRMKGYSFGGLSRVVREALEEVGLWEFRNRLVKRLSGGMRRRLSVAISLLGRPKMIFFDEPTTGLDPESRRDLWNVLLRVKQRTAILLTTHSMEEADVLCDRIGVMSKGEFKCIGPQQVLKERYGKGYTLKITHTKETQESAMNFVAEMLPTAELRDSFATQTVYEIERADIVLSAVFTQFKDRPESAGISDWGINQTTLEDVFLTIARQDEENTYKF